MLRDDFYILKAIKVNKVDVRAPMWSRKQVSFLPGPTQKRFADPTVDTYIPILCMKNQDTEVNLPKVTRTSR